jgi:hypothetical protein
MIQSLLCHCVLLFLSIQIAHAQPKLEIIGGNTYDWGFVKTKDSPLKAKIKLKNTGNQLLQIWDVKPGCGCTTAPLDKKKLKPGEIGTMAVSLNLGTAGGDIHKSITINSNDATVPIKVLALKANVIQPIQLLPQQYIAFGDIMKGYECKGSITVKNTSPKDIILSSFSTSEGMSINMNKNVTLKSQGSITLTAKLTPKNKGYFNGYIRFNTNHPDFPVMDIVCYGNCK